MKKLLRYSLVCWLIGFACQLHAQSIVPPAGIAVDRSGETIHKLYNQEAPSTTMTGLQQDDTVYIFPCCTEKVFYTGVLLSYEDPSFATPTTDWTYELTFDLYLNGEERWASHTLRLDMGQQIISQLVFDDLATEINPVTSFIRITGINATGNPPLNNITVGARLYEQGATHTDFAQPITLNYNPANHTVSWIHDVLHNQIVDEYELEWVFFDQKEFEDSEGNQIKVLPTPEEAFDQRTPTRATTKDLFYKLDQLFSSGIVYMRVRMVSKLPDQPTHRIYGNWSAAISTQSFYKNDDDNWQQVITFAEDGKNKKVLTYYDETLRPVQVMTNLNHEESTLISESKYDYEGRKVVDFLPFATKGWNPTNLITRNRFESVGHYDNGPVTNLDPTLNSSDNYYSNHPDPSVPRANGYTYTQTVFSKDNSSRVLKQSGVGEQFHIDGDRNTTYFYASATREELVRLFGESNVGDAAQYRKVVAKDPNGQSSVSYLSPSGNTIATALLGDSPVELDALPSAGFQESLTVELNNHFSVDEQGNRITYYSLYNAIATTEYTFDYLMQDIGTKTPGTEVVCLDCRYDVTIEVFKPNGALQETIEALNISGDECAVQDENGEYPIIADPAIPNPITFTSEGIYTIRKEVRIHRPTYEEVLEEVKLWPSVQLEIESIRDNEPPIDESLCTINYSEDDKQALLTNLPEIARSLYTNECEAIRAEIIQDILEAHDMLTYAEVDENLDRLDEAFPNQSITMPARYCEYEFCVRNVESNVFESLLYIPENWTEAGELELRDLIGMDDFFNEPDLDGYAYKSQMIDKINAFTFTSENFSKTASIDDLVNPQFDEMDLDFGAATPYHILYAAIYLENPPNLSDRVDEARWNYYRSFYLQAKNEIKQQIANDLNCDALTDKFDQLDPDTYLDTDGTMTPDDIWNYTQDGITYLGDISDQVLDVRMMQLTRPCNITLSAEDNTRIRTILRTFFNDYPLNILRIIPLQLFSIAPLDEINEILATYDQTCALDTRVVFVYDMGGYEGCDFCNPFGDGPNYPILYETECIESQTSIREDKIRIKINKRLDEIVETYLQSYTCAESFTEQFNYTYEPKEYHHTLYFYDRAGHLVQTVPPEGVNGGGSYGNHLLETNYYYNSLGQMVRQNSPDGGTTLFRYDSKGQLRLSENAEQLDNDEFSYTRYDAQGRIVEVGEVRSALPLDPPTTIDPNNSGPNAYMADLAFLNDPQFPAAG
ncbi:MAG: DUF6443 domain-containing protein, partial [Bacteroidota bacterium]